MIVLGLADNHDAGVALAQDGRLIFAAGEERFNREKQTHAFPLESLGSALSCTGIDPGQVDRVVVAGRYTPALALRGLRGLHRRMKRDLSQFDYRLNLYMLYQSGLRRLPLAEDLEAAGANWVLGRALARAGVRAPVSLMDHHLAHASGAWFTNPWPEALVITADAMGDGTSLLVARGERGRVRELYRQSASAGISTYYSRITEYLGFRPNRHEGKVTGLAAHGDPELLAPVMRRLLRFQGPGFAQLPLHLPQNRGRGLFASLAGHRREDVAAACQRNLEHQVAELVRYWVRHTGLRRLVLAGGIFSNVRLNQALSQLDEVEAVYVFAHMGDGGLPAGAALSLEGEPGQPLPHLYLGPSFTRRQCAEACDAAGLPYRRVKDPVATCAEALAAGQTVARFCGPMEYGPRALGHRSILHRPDDPEVNDWLNRALGRDEFMPLAPVVSAQEAPRWFHGLDKVRDAARFMTVSLPVTEELRRTCPGVVHVDGTARPQVVTRQASPGLHQVLEHFQRRTGLPCLINTSFNMHGEPIVCTPRDAVRSFCAAGLDRMLLEDLLVEPSSPRAEG